MPDAQHTSWEDYGGGPDQSKYVVTHDITKANVGQMKQAWFYSTGDDRTYQINPLIVDNMMYVVGKDGSLIALDAESGEEIWIQADMSGVTRRGLNYWESPDGTDKRILNFGNNAIQAIDAITGQLITTFGENGEANLRQGLAPRDPATVNRIQSGTPGKVFEDLLIVGSSPGESYLSAPGHVRAFNVVSGELVWTFHTIPQPGEFGYDTWPEDAWLYAGGANVWGEMSVDKERGIVYLPTGSPTYDYWGGDRIGQNLFGNSLIALDARNGERLWHYQVVHHDVWDYDIAAAPQLVTVEHDGSQIDAVAIATKHGFLFAFDRVTGDPLWPIEERPVPQSTLLGEATWPTQPHPTVIPPFHRQVTTSADLNPYFLTDEERAEWTERIDSLEALGRTALFVPPSDEYLMLATPGAVGGANWGNTAANPAKGHVYVYAVIWPSLYEPLELRTTEDRFGPAYPEGSNAPDYRYFSPGYGLGHAAVFRPPWSTLTAYDLNTGSILWQRPIGTDLMAAQEGGENTGVPEAQRNGMIVTSTGVLFSTAKDGRVYAFDAATGDELWSAELPRATEGLPAMYELNGRSYLVVTATSDLEWGTGDSNDELVALRPQSQGGYVVFSLP